jgi:digeranylgeranylglycerophospholipid reductase
MTGIDVDVLVIGGGPAGLATAAELAAEGFETLVAERQESIGEHVRTSGCTALATADRLGAPRDVRHELARLRFATEEREAVVDCEGALSVLDVRGFYRWLGSRASTAGAEIRTGARVGHEDGRWVLRTATAADDVRARVVVDASGYRAVGAKAVGVHGGFARFGVGAEHELTGFGGAQDEAVLVLSERYAPAGYGWLFPWGSGRARLGVGVHHVDVRNDPRRELARLREGVAPFGIDLGGTETAEYHFGLVPAEGVPAQLVADGFVAVGDAAGQATLVVGEGIRVAIRAGELAAGAIAQALRSGSVRRERLLTYERQFRQEFGTNLRRGHRINARLARFDDARWNAGLDVLRALPSEIVLELLESRFPRRRLVGWMARHPRVGLRSGTLLRSALGR